MVQVFTFVVLMVFSTTVMGYAANMEDINPNLPVKDESYWSEMEELKPKVENYVNSVVSTDRGGGHKTLSVPIEQQKNSYYCGPACIEMVLKYHGISKEQSVIGNKIGTTIKGSDFGPMTSYLNSQVGSRSYTYVNTTELPFSEGVIYSIDKKKPLICLVDTGKLPYYDYSTEHFIVVKGYDWSMEGPNSTYSTVKINDPNNKADKYSKRTWTCTFGEIEKGLRGVFGWYIMAK